jgi:hypothetical protein
MAKSQNFKMSKSQNVKISKFQKIICSKIKKDSIWILNFILKRDNFTTNFFKKEHIIEFVFPFSRFFRKSAM